MSDKIDWSSFEPVEDQSKIDWNSFEVVGEEEKQSPLRRVGDVGLSALKGAMAVPEAAIGLADLATGGLAGKAAEWAGFRPREAREFLDQYLSKNQQAANREVADAEGFVGTAAAALRNPSTIGHAAVEALPSMAAGGLAGRGIAGVAKVAPYIAGAIGEGVVGAGTAAERIRQQSDDGELTSEQAGAALASGVGTAAFGAAGGRIAQKLGVTDIDTLLASGAGGAASKGVIRRIVEGGIAEGAFEELPQSAQEQIWQNAALDKPLLEGVPESAAMGLVTGAAMGGAAGGALGGRPDAPQEMADPEQTDVQQADPLMLENSPDPYISFPDGTVGQRADVENFINSLPEDRRIDARARLYGLGSQEVERPTADDVMAAQSADDAIATAQAAVSGPSEVEASIKNEQIDTAWKAYAADIAAQREQEFASAEQARRDADVPAMQSQVADQQVEQANALTQAQGFDTQEPTAIELAMRAAQERRQLLMTPVSQRAEIAAPAPAPQAAEAIQQPEVQNVELPAAAAPVRDDGIGSAGDIAQEQSSQAQGLAPLQPPVEVGRDDNAAETLPAVRTGVPGADSAVGAPAALADVATSEPAAKVPDLAPTTQSAPVESASADLVEQAKTALTTAGVTGKDRLDILGQVRSGSLSLDDLVDAYPAKQSAPDQVATEAAGASANGQTQEQTDNPQTISETLGASQQVAPQKDKEISASQLPIDSNVTLKSTIPKSFSKDIQARYPDVKLDVMDGRNIINVSRIVVPQDRRNQGIGRKVMRDIIEHADSVGKPVALTPSGDFGGSVTRLKEFYKSLGFIENKGRNRDFEISESMYRPVDGKPLRSTSNAPSGITAAEVTKSITRVRAKWLGFAKVNTVQSVADLPADVAERANADDQTEAIYDPQTKSVHLIADNIKSPERATWVAVHEVIGHGGLRMLKDKSVNEALNLAGANRFVRDLAQAIGKDRGDTTSQVEEAVSELAAAIETNDFQGLADRYGVTVPAASQNGLRGTIARIIDAVRRFLGSVMGKPAADVSDADVRGLIGEQRKAVESESSAPAVDPTRRDAEQEVESALQSQAQTQWIADEPTRLDDFLYMMQDKQIDTKRIVQAITKVSGNIADEFDPRLQETLFSGRSAKATQDFAVRELKPLYIEMQARGVTMDDFQEFLHARHAKERNSQIASINPKMKDGGSGMKTADADKYLAGLSQAKRKAYDALAKRVDAINAETQKVLVDSSLEKQSTIDAWNAAYKHYVPLQRAEVADGSQGIGQGFSVKGASTRRAMGSDKEVIDILANIAMQRERAILRAEKNRVSTAVYGLAIHQPNKDFWLPMNPNNNDRLTPKGLQEMEFEMIALGLDPADVHSIMKEPKQRYIDPRTGLVAERINPALRSAPNVMALRVNGEDRFLFFSEKDPRAQRMATALKNLDADQLGIVLGAAAKVSRWFAAVNTQYNPVFGVVNVTRDVQGALMNLSTTPIAGKQKAVMANTASALRGIYADIRAKRAGKSPISQWARLYEEFQSEGGQTGFRDMFADSGERAKALQSEIDQIAEGKIKSAGRAIFGWLSDYNETLENAVRLAAYKVGTDSGMSKQRAAAMAKELTVNFNRKGTIALQAGALYAFFNASVQGTARLAETLKGPAGKRIIQGGLILGAVQALMMSAAGFDNGEPPEFVRERSIVIPTGDGKYIAIPMPLGFHVIPSFSRIITEWAMSGGKNTAKRTADIFGLFASSFNPIGSAGFSIQTISPTAADPFVALSENRDFTGKPIAREDMSGLKSTPGYTRAKDTASYFSEQLSYYLNLASGGTKYQSGVFSPTPDQIDYLIGQVTGGVGREYLKVEQATATVFTGEDLAPNKIPLVGRFYGDTEGKSAEASKFYNNIKRLNGHKLEIDGRRLNHESVSDYIKENKDAMLVSMAMRTQNDVSDLNKLKRKIMEKDGSKERVKMIELQIAGKMKRLNDRIELAKE